MFTSLWLGGLCNVAQLLYSVVKPVWYVYVLFSCPSQERGENSQPMREEDLIALIDDVLRDDDKNNDGYIDYAEFAKSLE